MRSRTFIFVATLLAACLVGVAVVYAYDRSKAHTIARGVTIGGVDVGGLSTTQAEVRLRSAYLVKLRQPVVVHLGSERFVLTPQQAHLTAGLSSAVQEALDRSRAGSIITRTVRNLRGEHLDLALEPRVAYSNAAVDALVRRVAAAGDRTAQEASVSLSLAGPHVIPGHDGRRVDVERLRADVDQALASRTGARSVRAAVQVVHPKTTTADVASRYPVVLVVDRSHFQLRLFKRLRLVKTYTVAVGRQGLETPAGTYTINDKQVNPSWHVPNSSWAGALAGKVIPPGPQDPIKARWMGFYNGAGIHGTDETSSLGSAASHGCIRMAIPDVIELYPQVPLGTPIYVG